MNRKILITIVGIAFVLYACWREERISVGPIKVGVLHSLTGTMAISEKSVVDATLLAIDEINSHGGIFSERGGIHGRRIKAVVADGASDWPTFAKEAERLIVQEKVSVVFGCWTSASRKTVKPIFEKYNHLLFYPVQYEGFEQSPNIIYTGAAPNQQIIPAVKWAFDNLGERFFLVASEYTFPRPVNMIIKEQIIALGGAIAGEEYIPLGSSEVEGIIKKIVKTRPDVILNAIVGDTNVSFFRELRAAGITPQKIPTMSFSIAENELGNIGIQKVVGDYAAWNYFQSINSPENIAFVSKFKMKYGQERVTSDPMEAAYFGVHLWAQAVEEVKTDDVRKVLAALGNQSLIAPEGIVYIDADTHHTWKTVRIGKIRSDGQFDIVWTSEKQVRPVPYPSYRSRSEWNKLLDKFYIGWEGDRVSSRK